MASTLNMHRVVVAILALAGLFAAPAVRPTSTGGANWPPSTAPAAMLSETSTPMAELNRHRHLSA